MPLVARRPHAPRWIRPTGIGGEHWRLPSVGMSIGPSCRNGGRDDEEMLMDINDEVFELNIEVELEVDAADIRSGLSQNANGCPSW